MLTLFYFRPFEKYIYIYIFKLYWKMYKEGLGMLKDKKERDSSQKKHNAWKEEGPTGWGSSGGEKVNAFLITFCTFIRVIWDKIDDLLSVYRRWEISYLHLYFKSIKDKGCDCTNVHFHSSMSIVEVNRSLVSRLMRTFPSA